MVRPDRRGESRRVETEEVYLRVERWHTVHEEIDMFTFHHVKKLEPKYKIYFYYKFNCNKP